MYEPGLLTFVASCVSSGRRGKAEHLREVGSREGVIQGDPAVDQAIEGQALGRHPNYIEGIEFTLDEAARIVFHAEVPPDRPQDAHDVLGTYRLVADADEMKRVPDSADALVELVLSRHAMIMAQRADKDPGRFKAIANRAGATVFVAPRLTEGTLRAGFEIGQRLLDPFARALSACGCRPALNTPMALGTQSAACYVDHLSDSTKRGRPTTV